MADYDVWVLGDGLNGEHEYLIRLAPPRFACKLAQKLPDDPGFSPFVYYTKGDDVLFDFLWLDEPPDNEAVKALLEEAEVALAEYNKAADQLGEIDYDWTARRLIEFRKDLGLTQEEFARVFAISTMTVSRNERGVTSPGAALRAALTERAFNEGFIELQVD